MKFSKKTTFIVLAVIVVVIQSYYFVTDGTILGIHVRNVSKSVAVYKTNSTDKPSIACDKATPAEVEGVLGTAVERIGGMFADRTDPTLISLCTYRSKEKPSRSVTIILRDSKNEGAAKQSMAELAKRKGAKDVSGIGDQASFSSTSQQLAVRKGKRIVTVSVNKPNNVSIISSQEAAQQIAEQLL